MLRRNATAILSFCLLLSTALLAQDSKRGLAGRWEAPSARRGGASTFVFIFEVQGNALTGTYGTVADPTAFTISDGKIDGNNISFSRTKDGKRLVWLTGKLYGDQLSLMMSSMAAPEKPIPLTAFRNPGNTPFDWTTSEDH